MSGSKKKAGDARRQYTKAFNQEAVDLSECEGISVAAERLGVPRQLRYNWRNQLGKDGSEAFRGHGHRMTLEAENAKLRRDLSAARMERDILKKATAFFAKDHR